MFIKKTIRAAFFALFSLSSLLLTSCGDGPTTGNGTTAPGGMHDLVILLSNNVTIQFVADFEQSTTGIETGSLIYAKNSAANITLTSITGASSTFFWPDFFTATRYTYQLVGDASAIVSFFGTTATTSNTNGLPVIFAATSETNPAEFTILFEETGGVLTSLESTLTFPAAGILYTGTNAATISTVDGDPVEAGYIADEQIFNSLNDGTFDGDFMTITDSNGDILQYIFTGTPPFSPASSLSEEGIVTITNGTTSDVFEANYTVEPIEDTNIIAFTIEYTGSSTGAIPSDLSYDLTFTSTVGGTYVDSEGTSSVFTFFATGP